MTELLECANPQCGGFDITVQIIGQATTGDGSLVDVFTIQCRKCCWLSTVNRYAGPPRELHLAMRGTIGAFT